LISVPFVSTIYWRHHSIEFVLSLGIAHPYQSENVPGQRMAVSF
jgi:hypothetical protein